MVIAAIVGGIAGAALLLAAYFVGVALVGAGIGALLVNVIWTQIEGDPHPAVVILFSVAGAVVATWLQRYVIILGTAFARRVDDAGRRAGGDGRQRSAEARRRPAMSWVAYPLNPAPGHALAAVGVVRARRVRHAGADALDRRRSRARRQGRTRRRRRRKNRRSGSGIRRSGDQASQAVRQVAPPPVRSDTHLRFASLCTSLHTT